MTAQPRPLTVSNVVGLIKKFDLQNPRPSLGSLMMGLDALAASFDGKPDKEKAYITNRFHKLMASGDIHTRLLAASVLQKITKSYDPLVRISRWLRAEPLPPNEAMHAFHGYLAVVFDGAAGFSPRQRLKLDRHCRFIYRALFKRARAQFAGSVTRLEAFPKGPDQKVALCTGQFIGRRHAPTAHILSMAEVLTDMGYQVKIFNQSLTPLRIASGFFFPYHAPKFEDLNTVEALSLGNGKTVQFWQNPLPDAGEAAFSGFVDALDAFQPGRMISLGPANLFADIAGQYVPHASMPTTVDISIGEAGSYGCVRPLTECQLRVLEPLGISQPRIVDLPSGFARPETAGPVVRSEFGLNDKDYAVAIVTNRGHCDLSHGFLSALETAIAAAPHLKIAIFGSTNMVTQAQKAFFAGHRQISFHGFATDLYGTLTNFDAVLNPPRQGGGTSAAYAMDLGLNVFTLGDCDVANVVGSEFIYPSEAAMVAALVAAASDPHGSAQKSVQAKARWTVISDREGQMRLMLEGAQTAEIR